MKKHDFTKVQADQDWESTVMNGKTLEIRLLPLTPDQARSGHATLRS